MSSRTETYEDARDSAYAARARAHSVRQDAEEAKIYFDEPGASAAAEIVWGAAIVAGLEWIGAELHAIQISSGRP